MSASPYETDLDRCAANYVPLSPLSFLPRAAAVYPDRIAVVHGAMRITYRELFARCRRLASALAARGIGLGDTVSVMAANIPAMIEAHYGVPASGAVLNTLNVRLDAAAIAFALDHAEAKVLLTDRAFSATVKAALGQAKARPLVIDIDEPEVGGEFLGTTDYERFIAGGDPDHPWTLPDDEWRAISLNYTSGTTGNPKGVVYHHRGAYLNAVANVLSWPLPPHPIYLWTLPMFHCNGWCFPWSLSLVAGTHVCLRRVEARTIFRAIADHRITHFCGAPIVLGAIVNARPEERVPFDHQVSVMTAAAPPPPSVLKAMEQQGFRVTHVYGLTETYGPDAVCAWKSAWDGESADEQARLKARQGVAYPLQEGLMVADPHTLQPVPPDGQTLGEVFHRGNVVMKGYLKNPQATTEAFAGGWFHSGDLGVMHTDGYIELKDRAKDIIISGGENISTIEVESVLYRHPAVLEAAVVARPDETWGESPCAFVTLKDGASVTASELIVFCRDNMAHFKTPKTVVFGPLPKTSTGKVQKFVLRDQARELPRHD
ncbi:MAG: acyl-CoA synthetase [Alphaproteobacteria bacterium]|nr:acyl-CoA synthetase [Alphaproteobacteria bacterium]